MLRPAAEVFAEELNSLKEGHGLWTPGEADYADVGIINNDGKFERFINLDGTVFPLEAGNPHAKAPPETIDGLQTLRLPSTMVREKFLHRLSGPLVSRRIRLEEGEYRFRCVAPRGVYCYFSQHSTSYGAAACDEIAQFVKQNHQHWVEYITAQGIAIDPDQLVFVRGAVKAARWLFITIQQNQARILDMNLAYSVRYLGRDFQLLGQSPDVHVDTHSGPFDDCSEPEEIPPGALFPLDLQFKYAYFLTYYRMKTRSFLVPKLVGNAEPRAHPDGGDNDDSNPRVSSCGNNVRTITADMIQVHKPLDALLNYILEASDAKAAIACHDDIEELCQGYDPQDLTAFLRRMRPPLHVDNDRIAMIDMPAIRRLRSKPVAALSPASLFSENVNIDTSVLWPSQHAQTENAYATYIPSGSHCHDIADINPFSGIVSVEVC